MAQQVNVGIVGFGATAQVMHAPFLKTIPGYHVKAVVERHSEKSKTFFDDIAVLKTFDALLERSDIDLVVITTPNDSHFAYAKKTVEAGKHVVLEKPFTITSEDAAELVRLSKNTGRIISPFHNRRYVADFRTIQQIVGQQLLGDIHEFEGRYDRYRPGPKPNAWREEAKPGSGILYDLGPHLIDQALCLFGLPQTLTADIRLQRPLAKVDDYFSLQLDCGLTKVALKAGMLVREPGPRYLIHGTQGSFIKWGDDVQEALLKAGTLPTAPDWGLEPEEQYGLLHTEVHGEVVNKNVRSLPGNFGLYYQHLYQTITTGAPLRERPEHGFNTIKLIELARQSSAEKRTVACEGLMNERYPGD
jgi:scyllo-inositol 2-dehydrogenase (NADP+)